MMMISNMPRYEQMKDSGVEWLGEIPEHWEIKRFKFLASVEKGRLPKKIVSNVDGDYPVYMSMEYLRGGDKTQWVLDKNVKTVNEDEILLLWDGSNSGEFIKSRQGVISSTVAHIQFLELNKDFGWFFSFLIERQLRGNTIGMGIPHVDGFALTNSIVAIPPLSEQAAIANFLDQKTAQIDQAITLKQKQIELFKERKQLVIQQAVTKGLNPHAPMRDSGVEWIGEIPEHWEVKKMKFFATIKNGLDYKNVVSDSGYPVIGSGGQFAYANKYLYDGEAVLLGRKGTIDKPLYINGKFWTVDTMFYSICNTSVITKFVYYLATVIPFKRYSTATALPSMTQTDLLNHKHSIPPLEEQTAIVAHIETQSAKIDKAIDIQQQQINKLKEYKATLINSAVTGKIKVV